MSGVTLIDMDITNTIKETILRWLHTGLLGKLFFSTLIIIGVWMIRQWLLSMALKRTESASQRYQWRTSTRIAAVLIVLLLIMPIWAVGFEHVATYLGFLTAGVAISLQEIILNFVGFLFIITRRPFNVGDRIQINQYAGDVVDQGFFQFTLLEIGNWIGADQSTGRLLTLPNSMVIRNVVANYTGGFEFIWNEIPVLITHSSDWRKAKELFLQIAQQQTEELSERARELLNQASMQYYVYYEHLSPTVYMEVKERGILLTLRYVCEPRRRRDSTQRVWEEILEVLDKNTDIQLVRA